MRKVVIVQFEADQPQEFTLHADEAQPAADEARRWLDEQFVANECEPLRPSGKVLTADKVMAGLGGPPVRLDVYSGSISY